MYSCKILIISILIVYSTAPSFSQSSIKGLVSNDESAIPFASISIEKTRKGTYSNELGYFELPFTKGDVLIITSVGYFKYRVKPDTLNGFPIHLNLQLKKSQLQLNQVVVTGSMKQTFVKESPVKVEVLTSTFLAKSPTNNIVKQYKQ